MFVSTCKAKARLLVILTQAAIRAKTGLPLHQNRRFGPTLPRRGNGREISFGPALSKAIQDRPSAIAERHMFYFCSFLHHCDSHSLASVT